MGKAKTETSTKKNFVVMGIIYGLLAVMIAVAIFFIFNTNSQEPAGVVQFNTNPSVCMVVNKSDRVIGVQYLNKEAEIAFSNTDFVGKNITEAGKLFVKLCSETNYINVSTSSSGTNVEIIISNVDEKKVDSLGKKLKTIMNEYFDDNGVIAGATYLPLKDVQTEAEEQDILANKYILIKTALKMHIDYTEQELKKMLDDEILKVILDRSKEMKDISQERYEKYLSVHKDCITNFESKITALIKPISEKLKNSTLDLKISLNMTFDELKSQILKYIDDENLKSSIESLINNFEKSFNELSNKAKKEFEKQKTMLIQESKTIIEDAKKALDTKISNNIDEFEKTREYYKEHREEIESKNITFRANLEVNVKANFGLSKFIY